MRINKSGLLWVALALGACGTDKTSSDDSNGSSGGSGGSDVNHRPVADAGSDITQDTLAKVDLDGRGSTDPDGDTLTFTWSFDRVPDESAILSREAPFSENYSTDSATSFRPDAVGTYIVKLVVKDTGGKESRPDYAVITITDAGTPIADAGADQEGAVGDSFTMDGSHSYDPSGASLTYKWSLDTVPDGSSASLADATAASTTFTGDKAGLYIATLIVKNSSTKSDPDSAVILVSSPSTSAPIADAGEDMAAQDCKKVTLDGSGSYDPDASGTLSYLWSIQSKPSNSSAKDSTSFSDRTAENPTFYPDQAGTYILSVTVFDGDSWATPDTMTLTVTDRTFNSEPAVEAGSSATYDGGYAECVEEGYGYDCDSCADMTVTLGSDASVSDGDADPYTLGWTLVSGNATITDATSLATTVTLEDAAPTEPDACESNEYVFQLSATDCPGETATDTVTLTVTCCGIAADTSSSFR